MRRGSGTGGRKPPALRVAVGADLGLAVHRQKVQPVPQRRQPAAGCYRRIGIVERGAQRRHWRRLQRVVMGLAAAGPGLQRVLYVVHVAVHPSVGVEAVAASDRRLGIQAMHPREQPRQAEQRVDVRRGDASRWAISRTTVTSASSSIGRPASTSFCIDVAKAPQLARHRVTVLGALVDRRSQCARRSRRPRPWLRCRRRAPAGRPAPGRLAAPVIAVTGFMVMLPHSLYQMSWRTLVDTVASKPARRNRPHSDCTRADCAARRLADDEPRAHAVLDQARLAACRCWHAPRSRPRAAAAAARR